MGGGVGGVGGGVGSGVTGSEPPPPPQPTIKKILQTIKKSDNLQFVENNYEAIAKSFNWEKINEQYLQLFEQCLERNSTRK